VTDVVIGVGTNLGDRLSHLRAGVRRLRGLPSLAVAAVSPIYESDALVPDGAPGDWRKPYLNLAVRAEWSGEPRALLRELKTVETELGRRPRERWSPREVDFDLLTFGGLEVSEPDLVLPHPGLLERPFALLPWTDVGGERRGGGEAGSAPGGEKTRRRLARWRADPETVPLRTRRTFFSLTELVGIVNITPDSFSDGGRWLAADHAAAHARALIGDGASVLDLGAESTRPGSSAVTADEEWARLCPVLDGLGRAEDRTVVTSVDTRHSATARRAIAAGADWINDVTGFEDPEMLAAVAGAPVDVVAMHSLGIPPSRVRTLPPDADPVEALLEWGEDTVSRLAQAGVARARIILDPGIGFGKTPDQNAEILRRPEELFRPGIRILIGHSRKSFLAGWYPEGHPGATRADARDPETAVLSAHLAGLGVDYVRVHDVGASARAIRTLAFAGRPAAAPSAGLRP